MQGSSIGGKGFLELWPIALPYDSAFIDIGLKPLGRVSSMTAEIVLAV